MIFLHIIQPWKPSRNKVFEHQLTRVSGLGAISSTNKSLYSWLQTPVLIWLGFDVHRQADPFILVTVFITGSHFQCFIYILSKIFYAYTSIQFLYKMQYIFLWVHFIFVPIKFFLIIFYWLWYTVVPIFPPLSHSTQHPSTSGNPQNIVHVSGSCI